MKTIIALPWKTGGVRQRDYIIYDADKYDYITYTGRLQNGGMTGDDENPRCVVQFNVYDTPTDPLTGQYVKKLLFFPDKASMYMKIVKAESDPEGWEEDYNKAKAVLREICDDDMSQIEKARAIYEYLIINVEYDNYAAEAVGSSWPYYDAWYAEGALLEGRAVCDGIAKAYLILAKPRVRTGYARVA